VHVLFVIPARIGSSRIPHKPLCLFDGEPIVRRVARNVLACDGAARVAVASDDERVLEAVSDLAVERVVSSPRHRSGTERVAEVMMRPEYWECDTAINVQCDLVSPVTHMISGALGRLQDGFPIATCAAPLSPDQLDDPNRVKVEFTAEGQALDFSRSPISASRATRVMLHVGIYAYTRDGLLRWIGLPAVDSEMRERLEQLRPLEKGIPIGVTVQDTAAPITIDTLEDLRMAPLTAGVTNAELASRTTA